MQQTWQTQDARFQMDHEDHTLQVWSKSSLLHVSAASLNLVHMPLWVYPMTAKCFFLVVWLDFCDGVTIVVLTSQTRLVKATVSHTKLIFEMAYNVIEKKRGAFFLNEVFLHLGNKRLIGCKNNSYFSIYPKYRCAVRKCVSPQYLTHWWCPVNHSCSAFIL